MDRIESNLGFRLMAFGYKFRDLRLPRKNILKEVGIKPGSSVLDYGCGPGSYTVALAELVGESGKVYAQDIHPLAIRKVKGIASKRQLANVETILSDCQRMDIQGIDLARFACQFCKRNRVAAGATAIIQHAKSRFYAHLFQDVLARQAKVANLVAESHEPEAKIGLYPIHRDFPPF